MSEVPLRDGKVERAEGSAGVSLSFSLSLALSLSLSLSLPGLTNADPCRPMLTPDWSARVSIGQH